MTLIVLIVAGLAGLLHVFIFTLESFRWEDASTRKTFGTTLEQAATTRQLAYNQGFYNLFLAITAFAGIGFAFAGEQADQARLAVAVAADDPDAIPGVDAEANAVEDPFGRVRQMEVLGPEQMYHPTTLGTPATRCSSRWS